MLKYKPKVKTLPGPRSNTYLRKVKKYNLGWNHPYPFVHSGKGKGSFFEDLDKNVFLDFASQIASNPLGYNHPALIKVVKQFKNQSPVKYAGQDFTVQEHVDMIEEVLSIAPKGMNKIFLCNSGGEAVENAIKTAIRKQKGMQRAVSFRRAFHGRTLGALSNTNSSQVQKKHYPTFPVHRLPYDTRAIAFLEDMIKREAHPKDIGYVIMEGVQGEGGYNVPSKKLMKGIRRITKSRGIPLILDEVQSGMGRTGKWWAHQHFNINPDIMSSAKALQVGATLTSKKYMHEPGSISSTWGGGHRLDLLMGATIIREIKKKNLLNNITMQGEYLRKRLDEVSGVLNVRGLGLMCAFDLSSTKKRDDLVLELMKHGVVTLGCSDKGIRLIPPYTVSGEEIDMFIEALEHSLGNCNKKGFKHTGLICQYGYCARDHS
jgi:4-aminobutyrate aminotransferase